MATAGRFRGATGLIAAPYRMIECTLWTSITQVWSVPGPDAMTTMFVRSVTTINGAVAVTSAPFAAMTRATIEAGAKPRLWVNVNAELVAVTPCM